jgi:two-component sensor histidine kinase
MALLSSLRFHVPAASPIGFDRIAQIGQFCAARRAHSATKQKSGSKRLNQKTRIFTGSIWECWKVVNENMDQFRPSLDPWLILREMTHRALNEFTSAIYAVSAAAAESDDKEVKSVLSAVSERLQAYAQVQRALEVPSFDRVIDASAHLRQLLEAISLAKLSSCGIELVFFGDRMELDAERCWRLGLVVSELVTNAARHGLKERAGKISVVLRPRQSFLECRVLDNGRAPTERLPGRGLAIIQALARELDGVIDQSFGPRGSVSILIIPVARPLHSSATRPLSRSIHA